MLQDQDVGKPLAPNVKLPTGHPGVVADEQDERSESVENESTATIRRPLGDLSSEHLRSASIEEASEKHVQNVLHEQRSFFATGATLPEAFRRAQLTTLLDTVKDYESAIFAALREDLGKPAFEAFASEVGIVYEEIQYTLKNLRKWMRPERARTPLLLAPAGSKIHKEPLGTVLIIGPWNYPYQLLMAPLIGALAAGNTAIVKPSELAPRTSALVAEIIAKAFPRELVACMQGGVPTTTRLLANRFDHVFFTGSTAVGKIVMTAAARHLTPVTLELGGKSPCLVDRDANLDVAARRIVWGKFFNAGQTCIAPDYVVVHRDVKDALLKRMAACIASFFGEDPKASPDFARVVDDRHFARLAAFLGDGKVVCGGKTDPATRYIAPTILADVSPDASVMNDEIFGPILPVLAVDDFDAALTLTKRWPKPLALYVFTENAQSRDKALSLVSFGGGCVNDTLMHFCSPHLPFGGVGPSGIGRYHGSDSFATFSHRKAVVRTPTWLDIPVRYPPYGRKISLLRWLLG